MDIFVGIITGIALCFIVGGWLVRCDKKEAEEPETPTNKERYEFKI